MGGGRKNQAQRTKNNAKPSSSSRSADLLGNEASKLVGFVTLRQNQLFNAKTESFVDDVDSLDPNFQVALKKLNKKDAITKQKGLTELCQLCGSVDPEICKTILGYWAQLYVTLSHDVDNKVRERAQVAHRAIASAVGRNLAPHLRSIFPAWFLSQFDTYPPAASAAVNSLNERFPKNKINDVMSFCREEVFYQIYDNLLNQTSQTICKSSISEEDKETKYERVIACSLLAYAQFIELLASKENDYLLDVNKKLMSSQKFWDFSSHPAPLIRGAWYTTIISLCKTSPGIIEDESANVIKAVFSNLDENDPTALPLLWEASLHTITIIKENTDGSYLEKNIFPKLLSILEKGGQGNAASIYPNLLPLISSLKEFSSDKKVFFCSFFTSLHNGLNQPSVKISSIESETIVKTFAECFRFVTLQYASDAEFCLNLFESQLLTLINKTMRDGSHNLCLDIFYWCVADLVSYWTRTSSSYTTYSMLVQKFWSSMKSISLQSLDDVVTDISLAQHVLKCHSKFLESFFRSSAKVRKNLRVKFNSDEESTMGDVNLEVEKIDVNIKTELEKLASELMKVYYSHIMNEGRAELKNACINQLSILVRLFNFNLFVSACQPEETVFCNYLHNWLSDANLPLQPLLILTFSALDNVKSENLKKSLLHDLTKVRPEYLIHEAIKLCIKSSGSHAEIVKWLQSENVCNLLVSFCKDVDFDEVAMKYSTLKICLSALHDGEFVIGNSTVCKILNALNNKLECSENDSDISNVIRLVENIWENDKTSFFKDSQDCLLGLLKALFTKLLNGYRKELVKHLEKGLSCMLVTYELHCKEVDEYLKFCAEEVSSQYTSDDEWSLPAFHQTVFLMCDIIRILSEIEDSDKKHSNALNLSMKFFNYLDDIRNIQWQGEAKDACIIALVIGSYNSGVLSLNSKGLSDVGDWNPLHHVKFLPFVQSLLFNITMLIMLTVGKVDVDEELLPDDVPQILLRESDLSHFSELLARITYASCLVLNFQIHYFTSQQYFFSRELVKLILPGLNELISKLEPSECQSLISQISARPEIVNIISWNSLAHESSPIFSHEIISIEPEHTRIATEGLEEDSIRELRRKLVLKKKEMLTHISFMCWKITSTCRVEATCLFEKSLNNAGVMELCLSAEIARFLSEIILYDASKVEPKTWDFIMVSTASWIQSINMTLKPSNYIQFVSFVAAVCDLFITLSNVFKNDNPLVEKYSKEWKEVFASGAHKSLALSWKKLADECSSRIGDFVSHIFIEKLSLAMCYIVEEGNFPSILEEKSAGCNLKVWVKESSRLLLSHCSAVQNTSYLILISLTPILAKCDSSLTEETSDRLSCLMLEETLEKTQSVVLTMLQGIKSGVMCSVSPFTDSFVYTKGYLMTWLTIVEIFKSAEGVVRHLYSLKIKEADHIQNLMFSLLRLLPDRILIGANSGALERSHRLSRELFLTPPSFTDGMSSSSEWLSALSCWTYACVLRWLPLLSRFWYCGVDAATRDLADRITVPYVSPALISEEITLAKAEAKKHEQLSIESVGGNGGYVTASYSLEDSKVSLTIALGHNHPFTPPKIDTSRSVVSSNQANQKLRQLSLFPNLQNGSVWDCVITWKNYLDKKFEGIEECYICYSVLTSGSQQLPKLVCRTCRKKFHNVCLYKWFTSSSKSTCPICRNLF